DFSDRKHENLQESESSWSAAAPVTGWCPRDSHDFQDALRKGDAIPVAETVPRRQEPAISKKISTLVKSEEIPRRRGVSGLRGGVRFCHVPESCALRAAPRPVDPSSTERQTVSLPRQFSSLGHAQCSRDRRDTRPTYRMPCPCDSGGRVPTSEEA